MTGETLLFHFRRRRPPLWAAIPVVCLVGFGVVFGIVRHDIGQLMIWLSYCVILVLSMLAQPTVEVSDRGIGTRMYGRLRGKVWLWSDIEAVVEPTSYSTNTEVIMTDGRVRTVPYTTATDAVSIAEIGQKPLRRKPVSTTPTPPKTLRRPSEDELARAHDQRAARVTSEGARLRAELDRIRRQR